MATTTKSSSKRKKSEPANKAKVAFREYKQRLEHTPTAEASRFPFGPTPQPVPPMPAGWAVPQNPGAIFPQNVNIPFVDPMLGQNVLDSTGVLAERVGETLKLSMTLLNSGLGMGIRFLEGLTRTGSSYGDCGGHYVPYACSCIYSCSCCCVDCCQVVGCEPSCCCTLASVRVVRSSCILSVLDKCDGPEA